MSQLCGLAVKDVYTAASFIGEASCISYMEN